MFATNFARARRAAGAYASRALHRAGKAIWKGVLRTCKRAGRDVILVSSRLQRTRRIAVSRMERAKVLAARHVDHARRTGSELTTLLTYSVPGEATQCPGCRSPRLALLAPMPLNGRPRGQRFGFVSGCRDCGLVFSNPMPSPDVLRTFYSPVGEWGKAREEETREKLPATGYLLGLFGAVTHWVDVARPPANGRVLDFGCGGGELLDFFVAYGWNTFGIDPGDKRSFPRHQELTSIPCDRSFDVAVLHHVLEHVPNPLDLIHRLHDALKPGGVLFISVPRFDALPWHRDFRYCINSRTHIVSFTWDAMRSLLARAGFEAVALNEPPDATVDRYGLRRLRVMARRVDVLVDTPRHPLDAARQALTRYYADRADDQPPRWLPVRMRASLADRGR